MAIRDTNDMMFTAFEPKLQNRFLMKIDGIPSYLIKKISRPSVTFGEVVLDHIKEGKKRGGEKLKEKQIGKIFLVIYMTQLLHQEHKQ
jgi:hypothetical protein